jgi:lysozyme family protein
MAAETFERALTEIFGHEGGYSDNPKDPGNWTGGRVGAGALKGTKYGIAANTFPHLDIRSLTLKQAALIYRDRYWGEVGADAMPVGVDLAVFDAAVNSGVPRAKSWYAEACAPEPVPTIQRFCARRIAFLQGLKTWATFGRGWTTRVARIEATAVAWALAALGRAPAAIRTELEAHANMAREASNKEARKAAASSGGAAAGAGTAAAQAPDLTAPENIAALLAILLVGGLVTAVLIHRSRARRAVGRAYAEEAAFITV